LPSITPPSEDSSPSPQTAEGSSKHSPEAISEDSPDSGLKRKASDEDLGEGPSQKSAHTDSNGKKDKSATTKRKSSGSGPVSSTFRSASVSYLYCRQRTKVV
jgi:AP-1-like factor